MKVLPLIGRIVFSSIFIWNGIFHFVLLGVLTEYARWKGVPLPEVAVLVTGLMMIVGGLMVAIGFQARAGAALIVLFLVPTAFMMHNFWVIEETAARSAEMAHFMKNLSLAGAGIMIMYFGAGPLGIDRDKSDRRKSRR